MALKFPDFKTVVVGFIAGIFLIQILSLLVSAIFPSIGVIKGGTALLLMTVAMGVIGLFNVAFSVEKLKSKENLIFVVIVFALIFAAFYFGPTYFPQIFSIDPNISQSIKQTVGMIFGG